MLIIQSYSFLLCFFGKIATKSFEEMADILYESNWQHLSPDLQKYFVFMIANAQQPLYYGGYGVTILDLQTFVRVSICRTIRKKT